MLTINKLIIQYHQFLQYKFLIYILYVTNSSEIQNICFVFF